MMVIGEKRRQGVARDAGDGWPSVGQSWVGNWVLGFWFSNLKNTNW